MDVGMDGWKDGWLLSLSFWDMEEISIFTDEETNLDRFSVLEKVCTQLIRAIFGPDQ